MDNKDSTFSDILSSELKQSFEFEVSDDFTDKVNNKIDYKILKRKQVNQSIIIISVLILFLLSVLLIFHITRTFDFWEKLNMKYPSTIWRYKYIPVTILSLCLVFMLDKILKSRFSIFE